MAKRIPVKPTPKPPRLPRKPPYPGEYPPRRRHDHHHPPTNRELERIIMALSQTVQAALDAQDVKIAALSQKVDDFVASHQGNAADEQAIVDRLTKQGASVDAIAAKLV